MSSSGPTVSGQVRSSDDSDALRCRALRGPRPFPALRAGALSTVVGDTHSITEVRRLGLHGDQLSQLSWAWGISQELILSVLKPGQSPGQLVTAGGIAGSVSLKQGTLPFCCLVESKGALV